MCKGIICIVAEGEDLVVHDPFTKKEGRISWPDLSNIAPGLKYRSECINALLNLVNPDSNRRGCNISSGAEALIEKATEAARQLY